MGERPHLWAELFPVSELRRGFVRNEDGPDGQRNESSGCRLGFELHILTAQSLDALFYSLQLVLCSFSKAPMPRQSGPLRSRDEPVSACIRSAGSRSSAVGSRPRTYSLMREL